ncbi:hypothetical protein Rsub_11826 [Raphidocelis subcapitata]|uniref:DUF1754-domain-containing protein n=1 Tax=Raphidocelis subcapitata TaxID=307507 RepID=A0A2V0PJ26_9CHLO|nr:hypothetical protein Rsub_11826 [Raphidocelis subcapitata]|eukprot:GBF99022.1 hypothetical protein Rsub_11826 [Raphidocelis subcapitata]
MSFVGGKLTLKGGEPLKTAGGVKKKKKKKAAEAAGGDDEQRAASVAAAAAAKASGLGGAPVAPPPEGADRRTDAQRRRDERMAKLEEERLRKIATKGYRDRMKDLNEHLASLSEHHDIPKVGPG